MPAALVTKSASASHDENSIMYQMPLHLIAGADIDSYAPCYIKGADGKAYMCDGTAADEKARFAGFALKAIKAGQAVELFGLGLKMHYADETLTPGVVYYIGATAGRLDASTTTGDTVGIVQAIDASMVRVIRAV